MSKPNFNISIHHVTRLEGHGNIYVNVRDGKIEKCEWNIPEAPRFFEAMVVGRKWNELHHITSRICGICSIGHTLASLKATETAMNIKISKQDLRLRKLALHGENIQSHVLHVGYLVLPDLLGVGSGGVGSGGGNGTTSVVKSTTLNMKLLTGAEAQTLT